MYARGCGRCVAGCTVLYCRDTTRRGLGGYCTILYNVVKFVAVILYCYDLL